jgi:hypothetical protein
MRLAEARVRAAMGLDPNTDLASPTGEKSAKTVASTDGVLIVDYGATGPPVGVEITAPPAAPLERLNELLAELGESPLAEQDYQPVRAAQP